MSKTATSFEIASNLHLVRQSIATTAPAKPVEQPTNHILVVDVSGSMTYDLPKIREQCKAKLPKLLKEEDTVSIIWFSGRGEFGVLLEAEPVASLKDLSDVQKAIDRWLKPVGLTGFKEPLEEAGKLVERVSKKRQGSVFSLFFLSDGCDNQWDRASILKTIEKSSGGVAAATFVEYGYYADRQLLAQMAEKAGGVHIFAEDFARYEPTFDKAMQNRPIGGKRVEVKISGDPIGGFAFALGDGDLTTYEAVSGKATVPEGTEAVWYLSPTSVGVSQDKVIDLSKTLASGKPSASPQNVAVAAAYAAVSLFSVRMKPEIVLPLLKALGDVEYITAFGGCFGKQKYSEFMDKAKAAALDEKVRWRAGWDPTRVPADDAFTVLDLLKVLQEDESNRILLDHSAFKYSRISRGRVDADENLSADEQAEVDEISAAMAGEKNAKKLKELKARLDAIMVTKRDALKFVADPAPDGYEIANLTYNEERPNVSVLVRKTGTVDLSGRLTTPEGAAFAKKLPHKFPTFIYRNYAIIRDGLVNVERLPVRLAADTRKKLVANGVVIDTVDGVDVIDVKPLPVINRVMVKATSAKTLLTLEWELTKLRAAQKVFNTYKKEKFPKTSVGFAALYGAEAAEWLKLQGLTDYSGYSPKQVQAESKDFYLGKEMSVSLKGYSTLPSVKDVLAKASAGKLKGPAALMNDTIGEVEKFFKKTSDSSLCEKWLDGKQKATQAEVRARIREAAQIKFAIVVGNSWFSEWKSLDENTMTLTLDGETLDGKIEQREVEIKI